jgi:hypothetical protein
VILEKEVYALGKKQSCEAFRTFDPSKEDARSKLKNEVIIGLMKTFGDIKNLPPISHMCRSILNTKKDDKDRIALLDNYVKAYRSAAAEVVKRANELKKPGFKFHYFQSTEKLKFTADEVAQDCFHPSVHGNEKIAAGILEELKTNKLIETYDF